MKKLVLKRSSNPPSEKRYAIAYRDVLNEAQYKAVMHTNGPALVLAGAGTGKTRTLTYRVARLVEDGADPTSILLVTFTRKAAAEMIQRAGALLGKRCDRIAGGTFHAFGYKLLLRFGKALPEFFTTKSITVLDQMDAADAMHLVRARFDLSKPKSRFPHASTLLNLASKSINTMTPLRDIIATDLPRFVKQTDEIAVVVREYQKYKRANALVDYDDLLLFTLSLAQHETYGSMLRQQYKFIMVDEYQDTNVLQHAIITALAGRTGNVMAVGDDAQSIYSFRGADVANIHAFAQSFDHCEVITLEQNYRSTQPILNICNTIIRNAPGMFNKELVTSREHGDLPIRVACATERQQSEYVVQTVLEQREQGIPLGSIAVLFRNGYHSFDLEIELDRANIPYRKFGGIRFVESAHIKDILALLRITENPNDTLAWYRVLMLLHGVGTQTARTIIDGFAAAPDPLNSPLPNLAENVSHSITQLRNILKGAQADARPGSRTQLLAEWYKPVMNHKHDDAQKRWTDIEVLTNICSRYDSTSKFLADIALEPPSHTAEAQSADGDDEEFLTLSTIHSAKGLEWNSVFVISVNEGNIPSARSQGSKGMVEEERRLLYVACTRAKDTLILTYPLVTYQREHHDVLGMPSRFLETVSDMDCLQYILTDSDDEMSGSDSRGIS